MVSLQEELNAAAREVLENAIAKIKEMPEIDTPAFQFEKIRSLNYLRVALKQVLEKKEDPVEQLKRELKEAIDAEEYERAALIRDQLQEFEEE
jgi:excinuclease UvrABC helicase subunit UvrB